MGGSTSTAPGVMSALQRYGISKSSTGCPKMFTSSFTTSDSTAGSLSTLERSCVADVSSSIDTEGGRITSAPLGTCSQKANVSKVPLEAGLRNSDGATSAFEASSNLLASKLS